MKFWIDPSNDNPLTLFNGKSTLTKFESVIFKNDEDAIPVKSEIFTQFVWRPELFVRLFTNFRKIS